MSFNYAPNDAQHTHSNSLNSHQHSPGVHHSHTGSPIDTGGVSGSRDSTNLLFHSPSSLANIASSNVHNVSYSRGSDSSILPESVIRSSSQRELQNGGRASQGSVHADGNTPESPTEEDKRFFKLAKEAIVATANATSTSSNKKILDPTLNDLFTRLQYVSSPHGNPIKSGDDIKVNENGQLMIHEFYKSFPNLNNNIFQGNYQEPERSNSFYTNETGRLVGENPLNNLGSPSPGPEDRRYQCVKCSMNFKRSSDLKRHEKQHLEIPPNICHFCGKGFARKDALKRHVGTATCKRNAEKQLYIENLQYVKS